MALVVACPECGNQLNLPSREFLGRKGRCPKCETKFVMEESHAVLPITDVPLPEPPPPKTPPEPPVAKPKAPKTNPAAKAKHPPGDSFNLDLPSTNLRKSGGDSTPIPLPGAAEFAKLTDPDEEAPVPSRKSSPTDHPSDEDDIPDDLFDGVPDTGEESPSGTSGDSLTSSAPFEHLAHCPHCHGGVEVERDEDLRDFPCPHCQTRFCLIDPGLVDADLKMPSKIGGYSLLKQPRIGVGPFGSVYRARDGESSESIAIKVARGNQVTSDELPKFLANLRMVMQLKHPNIASLREVEYADDRVYYVSSYIRGIDLSEYLAGSQDRQLTFREIASLCALIASVLHHGHKFGVIHGNLKPSNVRLDADQKPYLFDFGLANRQKALTMTGNGRFVGTAYYLAPEQLPDSHRDPDAQTDVFALGVMFYELLTKQRPFDGEGPELLKKIARGGPINPRSINPEIPRDLEIICMKCLEVDPRDRFQSAMDVYKELRLYLEDKPINTKPPGVLSKLGRWVRRSPILAGLLFTFFTLATFGAFFVSFRMWQHGAFSSVARI